MGKISIFYFMIILLCLGSVSFFMARGLVYENSYDPKTVDETSVTASTMQHYPLTGFQSEYAVLPKDTEIAAEDFTDNSYASLLVDNTDREVLEAHNGLRRIYPASTTKLMTALVTCKAAEEGKISLDDEVTLEHDPVISDPDAVKSSLTAGCRISVRNLLYGLLLKSYNDYAVILAEYVDQDVTSFVDDMNREAWNIGATGTHFVNPNGLHEDDHYVTAYDMYLIINEAMKYDMIREIDQSHSYSYTYLDASGNELQDDITPTNLFLNGNYKLPSNIQIQVWKTGTTSLAGNVLVMVADVHEKSYTMFVADSVGPENLYSLYTRMFNLTSQK